MPDFVHTRLFRRYAVEDGNWSQMPKHVETHGNSQAPVIEMRKALARKIAAHSPSPGAHPTSIDGLILFRCTAPSPCYRATYEPSLTIFVQGRKLVNLGGTQYLCDGSSFL